MDREYWDALAPEFEDKVLQIATADRHGILSAIARANGGHDKVAIDFGCGIGSSTRLIAPWFERTIGIDFSAELIDRARQLPGPDSIEFRCRDLSRPRRFSPRADVSFAMNVLIQEDPDARRAILDNIVRNTALDGTVVIVVPALESLLHVYHCLMLSGDNSLASDTIKDMDKQIESEVVSLVDGIVNVGGEPTKHYTRDELELIADASKLAARSVDKVYYPWLEESDDAALLASFSPPWDWVLVADRHGPSRAATPHQ